MNKTSLDGRTRRRPEAAATTTTNSKNPRDEMLRPASPPKVNPWKGERAAAAVLAALADWPSVTPYFELQVVDESDGTSLQDPITIDLTLAAPSSVGSMVQSAPVEAAVPLNGHRSWYEPFGADIRVVIGPASFEVHRKVVEPQSTWFRDNLPEERTRDELVVLHLEHLEKSVGAIEPVLEFMYTKGLELCNYDRKNPHNLVHVPRSALLYIGAMELGVEAMKARVLKVLQQTATDVELYQRERSDGPPLSQSQNVEYLCDSLEVAYEHSHQAEMLPLRRVLARLLDILLPLFLAEPLAPDLVKSWIWERRHPDILADVLAARNGSQALYSTSEGSTPDAIDDAGVLEIDEVDEEAGSPGHDRTT